MTWIRFTVRALLLAIVFPLFYALLLAGMALLSFNKKARLAWRNNVLQFWCIVLLKIMHVKVRVEGPKPQSPFFMVSNHLGYLDILVYFTQLHCVFVSRHDVANWPLFGMIARSINTLFIDRSRRADIPRVNAQIEEAMRDNSGLIIFPEGTSSGGEDVLPFKPSLLEYAARKKFPVAYASLHFAVDKNDPPAEHSVCYWGGAHFATHLIQFLKLRKVEATIHFGNETIQSDDRKAIAQAAWHKIKEQFQPTVVS